MAIDEAIGEDQKRKREYAFSQPDSIDDEEIKLLFFCSRLCAVQTSGFLYDEGYQATKNDGCENNDRK